MTERLPGADGGITLNEALTAFAASMTTMQEPVPMHAPFQPAKRDPAAAVAVSVTVVPAV